MILYICTSEVDYGQDILYAGLVEKLGRDQVLEFPWNHQFYWSRKVYPRNLGAVGFSGLFANLPERASWFAQNKLPWDKIEAVVLGACKKFVFEKYLEIINQIPANVPVVFNDGGDFAEIGGHLKAAGAFHLYEKAVSLRPFDLILKREYLENEQAAGAYPETKIIPFSFGFNFNKVPNSLRADSKNKNPALNDKKYEVSFWAVESHPLRTEALRLIENLWDCRANGTERSQKFSKYKRKGEFYLEELRRSRVVLNFRGVGWDTLRYWEVPAIGGFLISEKPEITIPNNFEHGKHLLFCQSDLSDLVELCDWSLKNRDKTEEMARSAQKHAEQFHSARARADFFIENLQNLKRGSR
jgi:hypothetical protein